METKIKKDINDSQLMKEAKAKGIDIISITTYKDNNLVIVSDKDITQLVNTHIIKPILTLNQRVDKISTLEDVKKFLKGEL